MAASTIAAIGFFASLLLIGLRMPVGLSLGLVGAAGIWLNLGAPALVFIASSAPVGAIANYTISVIPLFIFMGAIAARAGLAMGLYDAAYAVIGHRRGGLAVSSIAACSLFSAISGTSIAATATMGRIAIPQMLRYRYSHTLAGGTIAAGGTLGILIPPSLPLIIYAFMTESSIGQLFAAALIPGLLAVALYIVTINVYLWWQPEHGPRGQKKAWRERMIAFRGVWPMALLFATVMGGIILGIFSPTEGAAIGAGTTLIISLLQRQLSWADFVKAVEETLILTAAIMFILLGVTLFDYFLTASGLPGLVSSIFRESPLSPMTLMLIILLSLILLGCFLDSIAIILITTPILFPVVVSLGFDPIWYGVMLVVVVEIGLITPPIGMNVLILARMFPEINPWDIYKGAATFLISDILRIVLLLLFPAIVLWLPDHLYGVFR